MVPTHDVVRPAGETDIPDRIVDRNRAPVIGDAPAIRIKVQENFLAASTKAEVDDGSVFRRDVELARLQRLRSRVDEDVTDLGDLGHHARSV